MSNQELETLEGAFDYLYFHRELTDPQVSMFFSSYEDFFKEEKVERGISERTIVKEFQYNIYSNFDNPPELELDISQYETMNWYSYSCGTETFLEKTLLLPIGNGEYLDMSDYFAERLVDTSSEFAGFDNDYLLVYQQDDLAIVFTKADKLKSERQAKDNVQRYLNELKKQWEELPPHFITSSEKRIGRDELLGYIEQINNELYK